MAFAEGTPTVTVDLGGSPRELAFTLGAMRRVREALGTLEFKGGDEEGLIVALPTYLWACMGKQDREELSVEIIEDLIHPGNMRQLSDRIAELFQASTPEGAEGNGAQASKAPKVSAKK